MIEETILKFAHKTFCAVTTNDNKQNEVRKKVPASSSKDASYLLQTDHVQVVANKTWI